MDPFERASRQAEAILDCKENISNIWINIFATKTQRHKDKS
jgi:hypothetical protein